MSSSRTRFIFAGLAVCLLTACETVPVAPPPAPEPPPPEPVVEAPPPVVAPPPAPPAKPAKKPKKTAKKQQEAPPADTTAIQQPANLESVSLAPKTAEPAIKGPAWLSRCASKRMEGGVILCDADTLIVQPSANVRVFTRDRALAGNVADGGAISYREGLPRRYRLFVVP